MSARTHEAPRKDEMRSNQKSASAAAIDHHMPSMIAGATMIGAACLIGLCGVITGGTAVFAAMRHWLQEADMTPGEMLRHKLDRSVDRTKFSFLGSWRTEKQGRLGGLI